MDIWLKWVPRTGLMPMTCESTPTCLDHVTHTLDQAEYPVAGLLEYLGPTPFQKAKLSENVYTVHVSVRIKGGPIWATGHHVSSTGLSGLLIVRQGF